MLLKDTLCQGSDKKRSEQAISTKEIEPINNLPKQKVSDPGELIGEF
jgi:hypothetical protein